MPPRSQLKVNVNPALSRKTVAGITPGDVRRMPTAIRARRSGDLEVLSAHRVAVSVLEWCRRERTIAENIASHMPPKKTKAGRARGSLRAPVPRRRKPARARVAPPGRRPAEQHRRQQRAASGAGRGRNRAADGGHTLAAPQLHDSRPARIPHVAYAGVGGHNSEQALDPYRHPLTAEGRRTAVTGADWLKAGALSQPRAPALLAVDLGTRRTDRTDVRQMRLSDRSLFLHDWKAGAAPTITV